MAGRKAFSWMEEVSHHQNCCKKILNHHQNDRDKNEFFRYPLSRLFPDHRNQEKKSNQRPLSRLATSSIINNFLNCRSAGTAGGAGAGLAGDYLWGVGAGDDSLIDRLGGDITAMAKFVFKIREAPLAAKLEDHFA